MVEYEGILAQAMDGDDGSFLLAQVDRENQKDDDFVVTDEEGTPFTGFIDEADEAREEFYDIWNEAEIEAQRQMSETKNEPEQEQPQQSQSRRQRAKQLVESSADRARQVDTNAAVDTFDKATGGVFKPNSTQKQKTRETRQRQTRGPDVLNGLDDDILGGFGGTNQQSQQPSIDEEVLGLFD